jgi:DNA polymerase-1
VYCVTFCARRFRSAPMPAVSLTVPLHVEAKAADDWDAAH